jgi:hypothetical protein
MRFMVARVLIWGAAVGLLLTACDPAIGELTDGDAPAVRVARSRSTPGPAARDGVVQAQAPRDPALMHREQQDRGGCDLQSPRTASSAAQGLGSAPARRLWPARWLDSSHFWPGRNTPLRL